MWVLDKALQYQINDTIGIQIKITDEPYDVLVEAGQVIIVSEWQQQQRDFAVALVGLSQQIELGLFKVVLCVHSRDFLIEGLLVYQLALSEGLVREHLYGESPVEDATGAEVHD